jgi:putative flippase GtrA
MTTIRSQPLRFIVIGLASTALYFALLLLLQPYIASTALLAALCYAVSMAFNFIAQGLWTFARQRLSSSNVLRYVCVQGSALLANAWAMGALVDGIGLPLIPSQIAVTAVVTVFVYLLSVAWVYR